MLIKIFEEGNSGPDKLEEQINYFFIEKGNSIKVFSTHLSIEKADNIDYKTIAIFYEETE